MEAAFDSFRRGEIELRYAMMGDRGGPLVLCLHGFPEYWAAWAGVMPLLARRFFVVAPDQRGFNRSSKPEGVEAYRAQHLVADLAALADRLSPDRPFVLAGHDWGASVAYAYAFRHPERLSALVIANGVHPACFQRAIADDPDQRRASQYINYFRRDEADEAMSADNFARTLRMLEGFSRTEWMTDGQRQAYLDAWSQPGAMRAMLNWYRASPVMVPPPDADAGELPLLDLPADALSVRMPHLVVWGEQDEALRPSCLEGLEAFAPDLVIERIPRSGHWVLHERPELVAGAMLDFLAERGL